MQFVDCVVWSEGRVPACTATCRTVAPRGGKLHGTSRTAATTSLHFISCQKLSFREGSSLISFSFCIICSVCCETLFVSIPTRAVGATVFGLPEVSVRNVHNILRVSTLPLTLLMQYLTANHFLLNLFDMFLKFLLLRLKYPIQT